MFFNIINEFHYYFRACHSEKGVYNEKNTIAYSGIIFSFIIAASFFLAIIIPANNAIADGASSDFYGYVWYQFVDNCPNDTLALYISSYKEGGPDTTNSHYEPNNCHYNETAQFGYGYYVIQAELKDFGTQKVEATGHARVYFSGSSVHKDIICLPIKEDED